MHSILTKKKHEAYFYDIWTSTTEDTLIADLKYWIGLDRDLH